ncbi:protease modulator HflK [Methylopila jiangsuensis]|uniref:Protease modulator HflK n=1 Tax=Methylopila jiangsuensis TaxID=586230 RepID=A0A9W6JFJ0_9HYPH|nr:protease modulator HflK [Methylopila jiangsuensis]MDR6286339.1 membrane protease subunit HflK [Methylopila jiangsuensis]GLK76102.1 protease modulator HflK [Methylopila jiangsuensis]
MPWSNQSGGGGGGGPWGNKPGGPWGQGPQSQGPTPPDLDDLIRRGQERLKGVLPGGGAGGKGVFVLALVAVVAWSLSGFYRVEADEEGIVLRFGAYDRTTQPGLNYHLPYPIETVLTPKVTAQNSIEIGMRTAANVGVRGASSREVPQESLMLTGDENIVDVNFSVVWMVKPADPAAGRPSGAANYLFNLQNPESTIKAVAESAMREVVGRSRLQQILTEGTPETDVSATPTTPGAPPVEPVRKPEDVQSAAVTAAAVRELMQKTLDSYQSGIDIAQVQLQKIAPPGDVIAAFREVQAAQADRIRLTNEAQAYANRVVPEARGRAAQTLQGAEGYRAAVVAEAQGQASRFSQVLAEYGKAPDVTRERMFLETMERVIGGAEKVIIDPKTAGQGVVPLLQLDQLGAAAQQQRGGQPAPRGAVTTGGGQ